MTIDSPKCRRGCYEAGEHGKDCDGFGCLGCAYAETYERTNLCYRCWKTLRYSLGNAQGQHDLLLSLAAPSMSLAPTDDAGMIRGSSDDLPDAINVSRLSCAQEISDLLSQWVEWMVADHEMRGPKRLMTQHQRDVPGMLRRSWSEYTGRYEWTEPPARFAVGPASLWLKAQIDRLASTLWIADEMEPWLDLMSRAHALAPWRTQTHLIPQIECPACGGVALALFGGEEDVRCLRCRSMFSPDRYAIWCRQLAERHGEPGPEPIPYDGTPLTIEGAARLLGLPEFTLRNWRARGHLLPVSERRPLRFDRAAIVECAAARRRQHADERTPHTPAVLAGVSGLHQGGGSDKLGA